MGPSSERLEVVAAAIRKGEAYLLGKRPETAGGRGGEWEFPGGKVAAAEYHEDALRRELREELGIDVEVAGRIATVEHDYSDRRIRLHLYACVLETGTPAPRYHSALGWFSARAMEEIELSAADRELCRKLPS